VFGVVLLLTAVQLFRHRHRTPRLSENPLIGLARRLVPVSETYGDGRLLTRVAGRRAITPMLLVLLAIGSTDVVFALDSIPAVFGVSSHPYIVLVANVFALLGLRALYFVLAGALDRLVYLSTGLAVILGFIGVKLVLEYLHGRHQGIPEISTGLSLVLIVVVLGVSTAASLVHTRAARAGAGGRSASRDSLPS
jgi:tellurite resistance protein TerC